MYNDLPLLLSFTDYYTNQGFVPVQLSNSSNPWIDRIDAGELMDIMMMGFVQRSSGLVLELFSSKEFSLFDEAFNANKLIVADSRITYVHSESLDMSTMLINDIFVGSYRRVDHKGSQYQHGTGLNLEQVSKAIRINDVQLSKDSDL